MILWISEEGFRISEYCYTMGERMGRIGRMETDFFCHSVVIPQESKRTNPIFKF
jgi:hypothetical protein